MAELLKSSINLLLFLLAGFVAQWVFHGLTAHPKRSDADRVIHALILTALNAPLAWCVTKLLLWLGTETWVPVKAKWEPWSDEATAVATAIPLGFFLAVCANNGWPHSLLNWQSTRTEESGGRTVLGRLSNRFLSARADEYLRGSRPVHWFSNFILTKKTAFPSEWYNALNRDVKLWVILHLSGNRRIYGYPAEFPDNCDSGHFVLVKAEWFFDEAVRFPLEPKREVLIAAKDVVRVELGPPLQEKAEETWVVLHLSGERRIYGFPVEFPEKPDAGQYVLSDPEWFDEDNNRLPIFPSKRMMIPAKEVSFVEFLPRLLPPTSDAPSPETEVIQIGLDSVGPEQEPDPERTASEVCEAGAPGSNDGPAAISDDTDFEFTAAVTAAAEVRSVTVESPTAERPPGTPPTGTKRARNRR